MATQAQIQANRMNAQKSTGPRTDEGKAIASQNALKHGLCAQKAVIAGEDVGEFEFYRDELLGDLAPAGAVESVLAERVVILSWRLRRAERAQNEAFDALLAKDADYPLPRLKKSLRTGDDSEAVVEETPLGRAVVRDFTHAQVLDRLSMYERRIEQSLYKTMGELRKLRQMREAEPVPEKPPQADERWDKPQPACAPKSAVCETKPMCGEAEATGGTHQAAGAGPAGSDGASRQTKPMASDEAGADRAKRTPLAEARSAGSPSAERERRGFAADKRGRGSDAVERTVRRGSPVQVRRF